ncbi:hypothetical protein Droror1_Dr00025734 [Drosera rotundifolia]
MYSYVVEAGELIGRCERYMLSLELDHEDVFVLLISFRNASEITSCKVGDVFVDCCAISKISCRSTRHPHDRTASFIVADDILKNLRRTASFIETNYYHQRW